MNRVWFLFMFLGLSAFSQHQDKVDFIKATIVITPNLSKESIAGKVFYDFHVLQNVDSVWLDAKNMDFEKVKLDDKRVKWNYDGKRLVIKKKFKKGVDHKIFIQYSCAPKQTVYFIGLEDDNPDNDQVWTQGQGKYTSYWLPSFDDMEEKVVFNMNVQVDLPFRVVTNGKFNSYTPGPVKNPVYSFSMENPMSSYLLAFAIGKYNKQELTSESGVPIENYFYPKDSLKVEPTYRYTKEILDFFENEIGVAYPWQNYKQVPVHDFLYAGMENTGATIFSDAYVIDSTAFIDRNYVNINAHEMAHQWFGNLVTEKDGNHHWLHEGFATYYAYLAEKQLFGDDYFYWKLYDTAEQLKEISEEGRGESLLNPKASSLTFYEKGAWALVMLREEVGDEAFKRGIKSYLGKYAYKSVTVTDFLTEMEVASHQNLEDYKAGWLVSTEFPWDDAKAYLASKNESLKNYFFLQDQMHSSAVLDDEKLMWIWNKETPAPLKSHLISEFQNQIPDATLKKIFQNESSLKVRRALAMSIPNATPELRMYFESFLQDKSYVTKEYTLFKLWEAFPENRVGYLNKLEDVVGLPNKNVRLLWLTLALVTPDYKTVEKANYLEELISYTHEIYNPEIRQSAFQYLYQINAVNREVLRQLILATDHHSWQFRMFVRNLLDEMLTNENLKQQIVSVAMQLKPSDVRYLKTKIELP
ncbi:M1 family peptidase [Maribacter algicola]|uniref:Aminopeptidase N n=1 Tax=Maribacter algicola TaxID=2498892 RepID=A0A3R8RMC6_9FLAO|nr:M1 family metallopeptidase [Maribacter algicola]RRQ48683.1 M1 family peptidase [Maribacter algicola]